MARAFIFPGQGSQFPGMGKDLAEAFIEAREVFQEVDDALGQNLARLMFEGPESDLNLTENTQPALMAVSMAVVRVLQRQGGIELDKHCAFVAGHSLGEFSALVANGTLSFESGLELVSLRAQAMQKACEINPSTMAAVLGLPDEKVESICKEIQDQTGEVVVPANYNCPGQLVISGSVEGIDRACELLTQAGAKRAIKLNVGGAFHSPLMEAARAELEAAIQVVNIEKPVCAVYQNIDARPYTDPASIKHNLIAQLTGAVRWTQTVQQMLEAGATSFTEVGPGNVLQGLVKKVDRSVQTQSASFG